MKYPEPVKYNHDNDDYEITWIIKTKIPAKAIGIRALYEVLERVDTFKAATMQTQAFNLEMENYFNSTRKKEK